MRYGERKEEDGQSTSSVSSVAGAKCGNFSLAIGGILLGATHQF